jgi:hypothetical protein
VKSLGLHLERALLESQLGHLLPWYIFRGFNPYPLQCKITVYMNIQNNYITPATSYVRCSITNKLSHLNCWHESIAYKIPISNWWFSFPFPHETVYSPAGPVPPLISCTTGSVPPLSHLISFTTGSVPPLSHWFGATSVPPDLLYYWFGATSVPPDLLYYAPNESNVHSDSSFTIAISEPALYRLLTFHVSNLMSIFRSLGRLHREYVQVRGPSWHFLTSLLFTS